MRESQTQPLPIDVPADGSLSSAEIRHRIEFLETVISTTEAEIRRLKLSLARYKVHRGPRETDFSG